MAEKKVYTSTRTSAIRNTAAMQQKPKLPLVRKRQLHVDGNWHSCRCHRNVDNVRRKSPNPNQFDYKLVYSTTRITIAPILILAGLIIEIYAIFKRPKAHQ